MDKAERYVRSAINRAASEGLYEIPIEKTLIPRELALKLINEGYRISEWKDNLVISWDILGRG
jgi:hypothetical protein